MTTKPRKEQPVDTHVIMTAIERDALREWAREECRSLNGQILHILRAALARRGSSDVPELAPSIDADRVRDATRRAAAETRG